MKLNKVLFITSFIPVIIFKVVARVREATLTQAKVAMVIGLVLAGIQFILSKRLIKYTTYLEKTFLGFLGFGTAWNSLKLLIMNYRFHPFSCSRNRTHNGLSPLQLAAVDISNINWVEFPQRKFSSNKN